MPFECRNKGKNLLLKKIDTFFQTKLIMVFFLIESFFAFFVLHSNDNFPEDQLHNHCGFVSDH